MCRNLNNLNDIEKIAKIWQIELNMEYLKPEKNVRLSFKDIGPFCEYLATSFLPGYTGGGSGGMGFDLINKTEQKAFEVKSCCTLQNAKCPKCGAKFNDLFYLICPDCNNKNFKQIADSRFSINAKETLDEIDKDIFAGFIFCHVYKEKHDIENKTLNLKACWYKLQFDTELREIQLEYFVNQAKNGKKTTCNLLPNSFDFFKLCPLKIHEVDIKINYSDLNETPEVDSRDCSEYPRVPYDILRPSEQKLFVSLKSFDKSTLTADCREFTKVIQYRKKSLGKERGDTRSNLYKRIKKQN